MRNLRSLFGKGMPLSIEENKRINPRKTETTNCKYCRVEVVTIRALKETNKTHPGKQYAKQRNKEVGPGKAKKKHTEQTG